MMNELDALLIVSEHSGESMDQMLSAAAEKGFTDNVENKARFYTLHELNYIEGPFVLGLPVYITQAGKDRLEQLQELAEKDSKDESDRRSNKHFAVIGILVTLIIFILGVVIDHLQFLITFFSNLFR